jgi:hypothetical protein
MTGVDAVLRCSILFPSWNLEDEIVEQLSYIADWRTRFVVLIPEVELVGSPLRGSPVTTR